MKFFWGLLLGLASGVAIGLLVAPQSGEYTRALLAEQGSSLRSGTLTNDLRSRANEAVSQGRVLYARTKGELNERYIKAKLTGSSM